MKTVRTMTPRTASTRALRATLALAAALALGARAPATPAQSVYTSHPVHVGDVTGLELTIEGDLRAPRGGRLRWLLTAHEVVGLSDLRPAARVRIRALSSLVRDRAVAEVTADELGHAEVTVDVPEDAPGSFHVVFEAVSPRNVRRQFDLDVQALPARVVELTVDRTGALPGHPVHAWGRVLAAATGLPVPDLEVRLAAADDAGRPLEAEAHVRTDRAGAFARDYQMPATGSGLHLVATVGQRDLIAQARAQTVVARPVVPAMVVNAAPDRVVVAPGETVNVDVVVRTGDGRPVRAAAVSSPLLPRVPNRPPPVVYTDARGRARISFRVPETSAPYQDVPVSVSATRAGVGSTDAATRVRVARVQWFGAVAVEGVAVLEATLGAASGGATAAAAPRRGAPTAAHAPAARASASAEEDACGGGTATSYAVVISRGSERGAASGCVAIDPDATVRVRTPGGSFVRSGQALRVALTRAPAVARVPIEVALVALRNDRLVPLTARTFAPGASEGELTVPADAFGQVEVRARPLYGPTAMALRGGVSSVWASPGPRFGAAVRAAGGGSLAVETASGQGGGAGEGLEGVLVVLPRAEGEALLARIRARGPSLGLGDLRVDPGRAGENLLAGALAARTRIDDAAPAVLRGGHIAPTPAPADPASRGTLRDPWRTRARFVEGRLARVFRAIEQHVAASVAEHRDDVAVRAAGARWTFNREIFDAIAGELPGDGARGLGGAPLTIDVLRGLDPAFTYDNVARRITRRRMFAVLLALRSFVNRHALDLRWSWRGDPTVWLRALREDGDSDVSLEESDMLDGWGTALALRRAPGGHSRFGFVAPVPGYELVSAGPDERFGTADDVVNPFARVLPSGGAYARAVDEDGLVARLTGVELGRTTIERLADVFEVQAGGGGDDEAASTSNALSRWDELPAPIAPDPHALDLLRPGLYADGRVSPILPLAGGAAQVQLPVDDEPRTYAAVADVFSAGGYSAAALARFAAGTPLLVDLPLASGESEHPLPPRLRAGEPLRVGATLTNLSEQPQTYRLAARASGPLSVQLPGAVTVAPGETGALELALDARDAGEGELVLAVRDAQDALLREVRARVVADRGALPLRLDVAGVARDRAVELSGALARGGRPASARVVVEAPSAVADDPELDRVRRLDPALIAWAYTLSSRALPPALRAELLRAQGPDGALHAMAPQQSPDELIPRPIPLDTGSMLSTACALVTFSAADEDDTESAAARARATAALARSSGGMPDADPSAGALRDGAAVLVALATGAPGSAETDEASADPVGAYAERVRAQLREAQGPFGAQPTLLARAAAALLLADPADARGVALFNVARRAVAREGSDGATVRGGDGRRGRGEELVGTIALAVAAQQLGEVELAARLSRTAAARAHEALRIGGEPAFWLLAAATYGVYGLNAPDEVEIEAPGMGTRRVVLGEGRARVPIALPQGEGAYAVVRIRRRDGEPAAALARLEVLYERPFDARTDAPVRLSLEGDVGYAEETSALELNVRNPTTSAVENVVLEIQLPAGARFDEAARAALSQRPGVLAIELRSAGSLRVVLHRLEGAQTADLPLAMHWLARGRVTGLGVVAYVRDRGDQLTVLPPRALDLRLRPEE
jgi:hypothetical protein